jgi:MFS family permease
MLIPVMPMFLKQIGFSIVLIGILEGIAEAVAGLSKSYFGKRSDLSGKRLPFVQLGYALSAISKPMMAIFIYPLWIFFARTIDRLGKGVRTAARDAMLSDEATPATKGQVFGFNRSLDTLGAVIGPAIALAFLYYYPNDYKSLFIWSIIPGILVILLTRFIREKKRLTVVSENVQKKRASLFAFVGYWRSSSPLYKKLVTGLLLFAMFNSSDVFLLLKMKETGLDDTAILGIYIFYNLVYAVFAYPVGILADKLGLKKIFLLGLAAFAAVYIGFAFNNNLFIFILLFVLYGLYAAATDGISKAWITNIVDKKDVATAIGTYTGFQSIAALIASSVCGLLWYNFGALFTFLVTAGVTVIVIIYLSFFKRTAVGIS